MSHCACHFITLFIFAYSFDPVALFIPYPLKQLFACQMIIFVSPLGSRAHFWGWGGQRAHLDVNISPGSALAWWLTAWLMGKPILSANAIPSAMPRGRHPVVAQSWPSSRGQRQSWSRGKLEAGGGPQKSKGRMRDLITWGRGSGKAWLVTGW